MGLSHILEYVNITNNKRSLRNFNFNKTLLYKLRK